MSAQLGPLRRQLELQHRQRACTTAPTSRWTSTAATRPRFEAASASTSARSTTTTRARAPTARIKIDNTELYIGGSYGPVSLKYNYAVTDFFGAPDSKGSSYLDLGFNYDLGNDFGVVAHYGYQYLKGDASVAEIGGSFPARQHLRLEARRHLHRRRLGDRRWPTSRPTATTPSAPPALSNKDISSGTAVVSVSKTF